MQEQKYNLGLVSVSFRQHTPREILNSMTMAGLSFIEWGSDVHAPYNDIEKLNEIAELQKEFGVFCSSYGTYFRIGETPIEELQGYIQAAKTIGTDTLRLWCGTKSGKAMNEDEKKELFSLCLKVAKIAEECGVKLCMECHKNTFTENPADAVALMKSINSQGFRMYWQPFEWQSSEDNKENAKMISPFAEHLHVFNWKGREKLPLSEASDVWREYLSYFSTPRTLLLEFMPNGTLEELLEESATLKSIVGDCL